MGSTAVRNFVKLLVVPDPSARCTTVIAVLGSFTPGLSAAIAASFHFVIFRAKILARVLSERRRSFTPLRLYDTVIGAATVGKYRSEPPWYFERSAGLGRLSVPAKSTVLVWRSVLPWPEPPPA